MGNYDDELDRITQQAELQGQMQNCLAHMPMFARLYWEAFTTLKDAGFREDQAMEILRTKGWNLSA